MMRGFNYFHIETFLSQLSISEICHRRWFFHLIEETNFENNYSVNQCHSAQAGERNYTILSDLV